MHELIDISKIGGETNRNAHGVLLLIIYDVQKLLEGHALFLSEAVGEDLTYKSQGNLTHAWIAETAAHEWMNGLGYHRQLIGEQIPLNGRILAVADTYAQLTLQQVDNLEPEDALRKMRSSVGTQFDESCYDALAALLTGAHPAKRTGRTRRELGELTEREAEVLRLLALGQCNPQIAESLVISRKTVEHHLEHIYNKVGVTSRTSAVVYAVQHGIA